MSRVCAYSEFARVRFARVCAAIRPNPFRVRSRSLGNSPHRSLPPALYRTFKNRPSIARNRQIANRAFAVVRVRLLLNTWSPGTSTPAFAPNPRTFPLSKEPFSADRHLLRHRSSAGVASALPAERSSQRKPSLPSSGRCFEPLGFDTTADVILACNLRERNFAIHGYICLIRHRAGFARSVATYLRSLKAVATDRRSDRAHGRIACGPVVGMVRP